MSGIQNIALYLMFTSVERDIVNAIRGHVSNIEILCEEERSKARSRLINNTSYSYNLDDDFDLLFGLDIFEKFQVLLRHRNSFDLSAQEYYLGLSAVVRSNLKVRNDVMHGRSVSLEEMAGATLLMRELRKWPERWPALADVYRKYEEDPASLLDESFQLLSTPVESAVLHNLPVPDYQDTGFLERPKLEAELKKKLLGRYPVVSVLGEGGNGKTSLALRVLYSLVETSDHNFDLILWVSAKTSELSVSGIREIENASVKAIDLIEKASFLEISGDSATERLHNLLSQNKVLLVIDNYETVVGREIAELAENVPGESKLLFTSRRSIGVDLTVIVNEFAMGEARTYFRHLAKTYGVESLIGLAQNEADGFIEGLARKPLLLKWFVLGVRSGLDPKRIVSNPDDALGFCLDNVILTLKEEAQAVILILATIPVRASPGVLAHLGNLDVTQVHDGLAELSQAGLLELTMNENGVSVFGVRSFARTYVKRLINARQEVVERILKGYIALENEYSATVNRSNTNLFMMKNYKITNRAELLAVGKLKLARKYVILDHWDLAELYLAEAKGIAPNYFENFKAEALLALEMNDIARALVSYENALEVAPEEPQLHFFYAGLLLRLNDNERAAHEFASAIRLGGENGYVYREAARNEMYRGKFEGALDYLRIAQSKGLEFAGEEIKLLDLELQIYCRDIVFQTEEGKIENADEVCSKLAAFIESLDGAKLDGTFLHHVKSYQRTLYDLVTLHNSKGARRALDVIHSKFDMRIQDSLNDSETYLGNLKEEGRHTTFGFIASASTDDTFVHRSTVESEVWRWMIDGGEISFKRTPGDRPKAYDVRIADA